MEWIAKNMEWTKDKNKRVAVLSAAFFMIVVIIILSMLSMKPPFPPPPQLGVEVNLGNSNNGKGDIQPVTPKETAASHPKTNARKVDKVVTQSTEESVNLNNKKVETKTTKPVEEEKPDEPVIDNDFIFP